MAVHTAELPYQCRICEKGFAWKGHLKRHMAVHPVENTYQCSQCYKPFLTNADLTKHMSICEISFQNSWQLFILCGQSFRQWSLEN